MEEKVFLEKMAEILDTEEPVSMDSVLADLEEWDSLGVLTFLAEMGKHASNGIRGADVKKAGTMRDLYDLIG